MILNNGAKIPCLYRGFVLNYLKALHNGKGHLSLLWSSMCRVQFLKMFSFKSQLNLSASMISSRNWRGKQLQWKPSASQEEKSSSRPYGGKCRYLPLGGCSGRQPGPAAPGSLADCCLCSNLCFGCPGGGFRGITQAPLTEGFAIFFFQHWCSKLSARKDVWQIVEPSDHLLRGGEDAKKCTAWFFILLLTFADGFSI